MFSLTKILALVAILGAVWYGFRLISRLDTARKQKVERERDPARERDSASPPRHAADDGVLDLVKDERGNYVAKAPRDDRV